MESVVFNESTLLAREVSPQVGESSDSVSVNMESPTERSG